MVLLRGNLFLLAFICAVIIFLSVTAAVTLGNAFFRPCYRDINAVHAGGTVYVAAGTYATNIKVIKSLTILGDPGDAAAGPGPNAPVIDGGGAMVDGSTSPMGCRTS